MFHSFQSPLEPLRTRWRAGRRTLGANIRGSFSIVRKDKGRGPLVYLLLWVLPAFLITALSVATLNRAVGAYDMTSVLGSAYANDVAMASLGIYVLDLLRSVFLRPLLFAVLAYVLSAAMDEQPISPLRIIGQSARDWRRLVWIGFLCMFATRLLGYLPVLLGYGVGLVVLLLSALFSWVPGMTTFLNEFGNILVVLLQSLVTFFALGITHVVWIEATAKDLRGMQAMLAGIRTFRERIGELSRLYGLWFLLYFVGAGGIWLAYAAWSDRIPWLLPALLGPVLEGLALLMACAGNMQVLYGKGSGGSHAVKAHIGPKDLSHLKSANLTEER